jgi:hypothetical protein
VDPDVADKVAQWTGLANTAALAKEQLEPLAQFAGDARDVDTLSAKLGELAAAASTASATPAA